ncbi:hypothetical protein BCR44DRAFT_369814 [Catenaria anguillulae PL171]|uniref:Uncharacterized protein n=1 Tax=Catenaria anguillulae PL171 TaxID=765915 RepID=A0A1Y2H8U3_9FUNG|nr:hypothetical protein BCR44DRAFT_369814 [Catenaria anguillulae PL171]
MRHCGCHFSCDCANIDCACIEIITSTHEAPSVVQHTMRRATIQEAFVKPTARAPWASPSRSRRPQRRARLSQPPPPYLVFHGLGRLHHVRLALEDERPRSRGPGGCTAHHLHAVDFAESHRAPDAIRDAHIGAVDMRLRWTRPHRLLAQLEFASRLLRLTCGAVLSKVAVSVARETFVAARGCPRFARLALLLPLLGLRLAPSGLYGCARRLELFFGPSGLPRRAFHPPRCAPLRWHAPSLPSPRAVSPPRPCPRSPSTQRSGCRTISTPLRGTSCATRDPPRSRLSSRSFQPLSPRSRDRTTS